MNNDLPPSQPQEPMLPPGETHELLPSSTNQNRARHRRRTIVIIVLVVVLFAIAGFVSWKVSKGSSDSANSTKTSKTNTASNNATPKVDGVQLDTSKNYGNKYANGLLPVGDNKYVTGAAKKGYIYTCHTNFVPAGQAGAQQRGPWFTNNNTQYDINKKSAIQGNVDWTPQMSNVINGSTRIISTNDLPDHHTGIFPVGKTDPARVYDANPNSISAQDLTYYLNASPVYGEPQCVGGEVGVMLTGVALFDGFDAGGRDAGAWEVQDSCDGHPQNKGEYHYHTLSRCITDTSVSTVIGFALDGYPITGPKVGENNILTTDDLDECHGLTGEINLDGKNVTLYHYVMTQDFPYSVSCYRSQPIQPPGRPE